MPGEFEITVDVARDLVRTRLSGFFDEEALQRYLADRAAAFRRLRCAPNQWLSLTDVRDMAIQSQEVVQRFGEILADPAYRSRRLAFVVASTLARMQLKRAIGDRSAQVFFDSVEAEAWLFPDEAQRRDVAA